MPAYTLSRESYELLAEALGEKQKAETFARAMERLLQDIEERANEAIVEKKGQIKLELRDELRGELVTRELFEGRMKVMDERFKSLEMSVNERFNRVDDRFKSLEAEQRDLRREMNERFDRMNERFDHMNERFDQTYQHFETLFDRQNRHAETRFDNMNKLIISQTRWMVGSTVGFGTLITILLAVSQLAP